MMPHMSGRELVAALRAMEDHATPPIVLMSAAGARSTESIGADATLSKPFDIAEVEALLARFIGRP
jgi:DNA-binding response OmpR family regulator